MSQIETIMLVALGFVVAALLALVASRLIWKTAIGLGKRRSERSAPATIAALQAERDQLRAEHAMLSRKLELRLEDLKTRLAEQTAEVSRNRNRIDHLVKEVESRDTTLAEKSAEIADLTQQMQPLEIELATRTQAAQQLKEQMREREEEYVTITSKRSQLEAQIAERDREIIVLRQELESRPGPIELTSEVESTQSKLQQQIAELTTLSAQIATQRTEMSEQFDKFAQLQKQAETQAKPSRRTKAASKKPANTTSATSDTKEKPAAQKRPRKKSVDSKVEKIQRQGQSLEQKILDAERDTDQLQDELKKLDEVWAEKIAALNEAAGTTVTTRAKSTKSNGASKEKVTEETDDKENGNGRSRQNVISLAARIRALQRKGAEN